MPLSLTDVLDQLRSFDGGVLERRTLESRLVARVAAPAPGAADQRRPAPTSEELLAFRLAETVCGMPGPDECLALFVRRVLRCVEQVHDADVALDLLPVILEHDGLSRVVQEHLDGAISRATVQSMIAESFSFEPCHAWLAAASSERLRRLCDVIRADRYGAARELLLSDPSAPWE